MSNMYFVTSDSLSDFMEVKYIIWAGDIEDLVLPGTWTIPAGQKKLKSECPHMPDSIKTLWQDPEDSNYVVLPDMTGRFCMMETDPTGVGVLHEAQAPNIYGEVYSIRTVDNIAQQGAGALFWGQPATLKCMTESAPEGSWTDICIDATRCSSIFSTQEILRPKSLTVLVLIKI